VVAAALNLLYLISYCSYVLIFFAHNPVNVSGRRICLRSSRVFSSCWEAPRGSAAFSFKESKPRLAVLRSAGVANTEDEARSPIFGKGTMPADGTVSKLRGWFVLEQSAGAAYLSGTARLMRRASTEELHRQ
jgi:hypothetical protein